MHLPNVIEHKLDPADSAQPWEMVQNQEAWFNGEVRLIDVEGDAPDAHLPIAARNVVDELPLSVEMDVARDSGSETLMVNTDSYSQLTPRYYGLVKPEQHQATMNGVGPFVTKESVESGWDVQSIEVPEGTKRLVVQVESTDVLTDPEDIEDPRYQRFNAHLLVGFDANNNGSFMIPDEEIEAYSGALRDALYEEMVCYSSSHAEDNYCNIVDPAPGKYWIATAMINGEKSREYQVTSHHALVGNQDEGHLSVDGPASHDGNGDYALKVNWDMPDAVEGEIYYGGFDLGTMPGSEGALGFTSLNVHRDADVLTMDVSQDSARAMDVVDVNVKLKANFESDNRDYNMELVVPEGLRLADRTLTTNNEAVAQAISIDDNVLTINGSQLSTRNVKREYVMSTNVTDSSCRTPAIDEHSDGGYIDLFGDFGLQPEADWMVGGSRDYYDVDIDWLFYNPEAEFRMYNQGTINSMRLHPTGAIQTTPYYWIMSQHRGPGFLLEALAPFWRGSFEMTNKRHWEDPEGLTIATQYADERPDLGDLVFLEYDNVTDSKTGESFDFEVILRSGYDDRENQYEVIYAYDNLGANVAEGAIFIEGGDSVFSRSAGFKDGGLFTMIGYNDLDKILEDDLVICFDYQGPEQSEIEFSFKAAVLPEAAGTTQSIVLNSQLGVAEAKSHSFDIAVQGNLKMSAMDDMTVAENSRIDGIEVSVLDADQSPNQLIVEGENITAEINGMSFNLIPDAHFHGETMVTVTVADMAYPSDKVSQTFMLTLESDGQEPPVEVTPEPEVESPSSGGSFGVFSLLALMLGFGLRRKLK